MTDLNRYKSAILIVSDRAFAGTRPDDTGPLLAERLEELGCKPFSVAVIPDKNTPIIEHLRKLVIDEIDLILISGGTGPSPRDVTPEATLDVIEKRIPGMEEHMRRESIRHTPFGMLSRGVVGIAGKSLIVNLPGSPAGAMENLSAIEPVLEHVLRLIAGEQPHK